MLANVDATSLEEAVALETAWLIDRHGARAARTARLRTMTEPALHRA